MHRRIRSFAPIGGSLLRNAAGSTKNQKRKYAMTLQIYSTLSKDIRPFTPIEPGKVGMYVCGVTVYDYTHIGHGRTFVAFDVVRRWLEASGYAVTFVRNVTDVDDKIINRGDYNDALKLIAEGLKSNPHSAQLRFQRCVVYERMGDRDKAINGFEQFIRTYPEIPEAYNNLAGLYSRNGNLVRAEELLVKAVALRPGFALAHMNLGNLYLAKAKNAYNTAIKTGGNKEKLNANIELLNKLLGE